MQKNDIDIGKLFRAKQNITDTALGNSDWSNGRKGKEHCYLEQGAIVRYEGISRGYNNSDVDGVYVTLDVLQGDSEPKRATVVLADFNRLFERVQG
jgi:hypothetical protein